MERHQLESCPVIAETNISVLRVAGDKVYKTKQPRTFPFVDQKSLTDRQRLCHQEVELNRRFSPDVYVGVEDITDGGETVDVAVVMERMSSERSLTRLLEAGVDVEECVKDVARQMAIYHQSAPRSAHISEAGTYGAVKELCASACRRWRPLYRRYSIPRCSGRSVIDQRSTWRAAKLSSISGWVLA